MAITVKAVSIVERKSLKVKILDIAEPTLAPDEFLIENVAVAQNPVDWKQVLWDLMISEIPWTNGCDVAGTIVKVGPDVKGFAVGDRVVSYTSRVTPRHGAYQTHSISSAERAAKLPEKYSFEQAATIGLGYVTAGCVLHGTFGIPLPTSQAAPNGTPLLVWGGSSSVGAYAIQLAKLAGYTVYSTASPANHAYVRCMGATEVFDYRSPTVVRDIRAAVGPKLSLVFDAISENGSIEASAASITAPGGGQVGVILPGAGESVDGIPDVKVVATGAILAMQSAELQKALFVALQDLLDAGLLLTNPVKIMPGGLNGVEAGWELGKEHKISCEKLVYRIADSKF